LQVFFIAFQLPRLRRLCNNPIIWTMVNAIKGLDRKMETGRSDQSVKILEQAAQIQSQSAEIADLKKENDSLPKRLDELEQTVKNLAAKN
jgi:predicted RNase H-like nuclease (RuvC/YqgF family)